MINCGERIAAMREKLGMTQEELSGKLGISRAALSHYETNRREPDFLTLRNIADYFHVSLDFLLCRIDEPVQAGTVRVELTDRDKIRRYTPSVDGSGLSIDEIQHLIAFVRADRSMRKVRAKSV